MRLSGITFKKLKPGKAKRQVEDDYESQSTSSTEVEIGTPYHQSVPECAPNPGGIKRKRSDGRLACSMSKPSRNAATTRARCPTVSPSGHSPESSRSANRTRPSLQKSPATHSERTTRPLSLAQQKKQQKRHEEAKAAEIQKLNNTLYNALLGQLGPMKRMDLGQLCREKLGWRSDEWGAFKDSKVIICEPPTDTARPPPSSGSRKPSLTKKKKLVSLHDSLESESSWPPALEIIALKLCILTAGGEILTRPQEFPEAWDTLNREQRDELKAVFVHRERLSHFLVRGKPSLRDAAEMKHRVQFFAFGSAEESDSSLPSAARASPRVEMILPAGAIIVPTFDSLFKNTKGGEGRALFKKLKELSRSHPFVEVCLHPSLAKQLHTADDGRKTDLEFLVDFLGETFDEASPEEFDSLAQWIAQDRNIISWLWAPDNHSSHEFLAITKTFRELRDLLLTDFRRFIVIVPDDHPYAHQPSYKGVDIMKISDFPKLLPVGERGREKAILNTQFPPRYPLISHLQLTLPLYLCLFFPDNPIAMVGRPLSRPPHITRCLFFE
ncbi:hypothetical protein PCANC_11174 [Puccinia coronata f. sp. avenae]|uniref:Uncharacterized protein n=1 Tax=Puccinia coronata f. sp. avenae TaxID=200324 RepID=A0A2N5UM72_9BASI|nr:hypothetical protein PCASD_09869 [Puccinia coronata f. sp. avenae]PLW40321.1 hypothetical protein PCANC_11174 [Puccinia coronata f. sp. avenae]